MANDSEEFTLVHPNYLLSLRIVVIAVCVLSILGASLIILTYVLYKDLRTTARQLLVNLSVANIVIAVSHIAGTFIVQKFVEKKDDRVVFVVDTDPVCSAQAAFTMFGALSSLLWTMTLAVYMFVMIVLSRPRLAKKLMYIFYPVCWGGPLVLTVCFAAIGYLGFIPGIDRGEYSYSLLMYIT